eukprot:3627149-Rhodomonas_salina.1
MATSSTGQRMPVTLDPAEKEPALKEHAAFCVRSCSRCPTSTRPAAVSLHCTTLAPLSRHGSTLLWCSCGPTITSGCLPALGARQNACQHRNRIMRDKEQSAVHQRSDCHAVDFCSLSKSFEMAAVDLEVTDRMSVPTIAYQQREEATRCRRTAPRLFPCAHSQSQRP